MDSSSPQMRPRGGGKIDTGSFGGSQGSLSFRSFKEIITSNGIEDLEAESMPSSFKNTLAGLSGHGSARVAPSEMNGSATLPEVRPPPGHKSSAPGTEHLTPSAGEVDPEPRQRMNRRSGGPSDWIDGARMSVDGPGRVNDANKVSWVRKLSRTLSGASPDEVRPRVGSAPVKSIGSRLSRLSADLRLLRREERHSTGSFNQRKRSLQGGQASPTKRENRRSSRFSTEVRNLAAGLLKADQMVIEEPDEGDDVTGQYAMQMFMTGLPKLLSKDSPLTSEEFVSKWAEEFVPAMEATGMGELPEFLTDLFGQLWIETRVLRVESKLISAWEEDLNSADTAFFDGLNVSKRVKLSYSPPPWALFDLKELEGTGWRLQPLGDHDLEIGEPIPITEQSYYIVGRELQYKGAAKSRSQGTKTNTRTSTSTTHYDESMEPDIAVRSMHVSKLHAVIQHGADGRVHVVDLSSNGTMANRELIPKGVFVEVKAGSVLKFGRSLKKGAASTGAIVKFRLEAGLITDTSAEKAEGTTTVGGEAGASPALSVDTLSANSASPGSPSRALESESSQTSCEDPNARPEVEGWQVEPSRSRPGCWTFSSMVNGERIACDKKEWRPPALWHRHEEPEEEGKHGVPTKASDKVAPNVKPKFVYIHASGASMTCDLDWFSVGPKLDMCLLKANAEEPEKSTRTPLGERGEEMNFPRPVDGGAHALSRQGLPAASARGTFMVKHQRRLVIVDDLIAAWYVAMKAHAGSSSDDVVRTWARQVFPDGRAASESGKLPPIITEFLALQAELLALMQKESNSIAARRVLVSACFTCADYLTDWIAIFSTDEVAIKSIGGAILLTSACIQAILSSLLEEPRIVGVASFFGLKPAVQAYYRMYSKKSQQHSVTTSLATSIGFIIEVLFESVPMMVLLMYTALSCSECTKTYAGLHDFVLKGKTQRIWLLALFSSLSAASLHFSNGVIAFDLYRSLRAYYPEYHGFSATKNHHLIRGGFRLMAFGSTMAKLVSVSALLTVSPGILVGWLAVEFAAVMSYRIFVVDHWRAWRPEVQGTASSLVLCVIAHFNLLLFPAPYLSYIVQPAAWLVFSVYSFLINPAFIALAFSLDSLGGVDQEQVYSNSTHGPAESTASHGPRLTRGPAFVWGALVLSSLLALTGVCVFVAFMAPDMRGSFVRRVTLRQYLSDSWETRIASSTGWGSNLDSARAHVVVNFSHYYWPLEKVKVWLQERWPVWCHDPPPWFTPRWRQNLVAYAPLAGVIPACVYEHIERDKALSQRRMTFKKHSGSHGSVLQSMIMPEAGGV